MTIRWEIGSEYHWSDAYLACRPRVEDFPSGLLFARARGALAKLIRMAEDRGLNTRVHLPSYFCMEVAAYLAQICEVRWYRHLPGMRPELSSIMLAPGDMVLALNMFGAETGEEWERWDKRGDACLIEDHSHDPLSPWAKTSQADYAIASLRKTMPVPDGALLWSPVGNPLPAPTEGRSEGADLKLSAMILKSAYLRGAGVAKQAFRALQINGEAKLDADDGFAAHEFTRSILNLIDLVSLRSARARNFEHFAELLDRRPIAGVTPIISLASASEVPLNPVLSFASRAARDQVRRSLANHGIFAPSHWPQERSGFNSGDQHAIDLSEKLLTVPLDFRCTIQDVERVAERLRIAADAATFL